MEFNEKLQELRKQKGLTQEELAGVLFVSRTAISKWESGRGYPNIDSLKAISTFFGVTIDELLSGDELLTIAEEDTKQKEQHFFDLVSGLLDCSIAMFFFLPFFGQKADAMIQEVSLLSLTEITPYLRTAYFIVVIGIIVSGILTLALQNCDQAFWVKNKSKISLALNAVGALLFIISSQPYAAAFLFIFLAIKVLMLVMCVMPTAIMQFNARIKNNVLKRFVASAMIAFIVFMVIGRLVSGVHWFTDIIGGALLSTGLVLLYRAISSWEVQ